MVYSTQRHLAALNKSGRGYFYDPGVVRRLRTLKTSMPHCRSRDGENMHAFARSS
jgi:hypothetical protein